MGLSKLIGDINKKFGANAINMLNDTSNIDVEVVSSGSLRLDLALGAGGLPLGRFVEIYGPESSGKTTIALHAIASFQKEGYNCAFIDVEHAFDPLYAESLGIEEDMLLFAQPKTGEEVVGLVDTIARSGEVNLIVVDSVAAMIPQAELNGEAGDSKIGLHARLMSQACRKLTGVCSKNNVTVIWINQIRMKIGVMFGSPETTTGGNALKFYSSVRLDVRRAGAATKNKAGEMIASPTKIKVVKNKIGPPFKVALVDIYYGKGISFAGEIVDLGVEVGLIEKSGAWYSMNGMKIAQGRVKAIEFFEDNPEQMEETRSHLVEHFFNKD